MCVWCVRGGSTRLGRRARAVCVRQESSGTRRLTFANRCPTDSAECGRWMLCSGSG